MKRRGPNSVANAGRAIMTVRMPKQSIIRSRVMRATRRALDTTISRSEIDSATDVAMIVEGLLWVAAEQASALPRADRLHMREHGAQFFKAMVGLEAQRDHKELQRDIKRPQDMASFDLDPGAAIQDIFKPVLTHYLDSLWDAVGNMISPDDPKGASLMVCAALVDVAAVVAANAPDEYISKLEEELIHTFKKRLAEKRARIAAETPTHEPHTGDGQL